MISIVRQVETVIVIDEPHVCKAYLEYE